MHKTEYCDLISPFLLRIKIMALNIPDLRDGLENIRNPRNANFPKEVLREVQSLRFRDEIFKDREEVKGVTIDSNSTKDIDDAIYVERTPKGYFVDVSVSHVDSIVDRNSFTNHEAFRRTNSLYLSHNICVPMLPRELSEGSLSLHQSKARPTITIHLELSEEGEIENIAVRKTFLKSSERLSYCRASEIMAGQKQNPNGEMLMQASELAKKLVKRREKRGSIVHYDIQKSVATTEEGLLAKLDDEKANNAYVVVQELMILANEGMARFSLGNRVDTLYRNFGPDIFGPTHSQIMAILKSPDIPNCGITADPISIESEARRAIYEVMPRGHFGLNLPCYTTATSPLRKFSDLVVQRTATAYIEGERPPYTVEDLKEIAFYLNAKVQVMEMTVQNLRRQRKLFQQKSIDPETIMNEILELSANDFMALPANEWKIVLKTSCEKGFLTRDLWTAIHGRIDRGLVGIEEAYYLLFTTNGTAQIWEELRVKTSRIVLNRPGMAKQILFMATDNGYIQSLHIPVVGAEGKYAAKVSAKIGGNWFSSSETSYGATWSQADNEAAKRFIQDMVSKPLVCTDNQCEPDTPPKAPIVAPNIQDKIYAGENARTILHNFIDANSYDIKYSVAPKASGFLVTCQVQLGNSDETKLETAAEGQSIRLAKEQAAMEMIKILGIQFELQNDNSEDRIDQELDILLESNGYQQPKYRVLRLDPSVVKVICTAASRSNRKITIEAYGSTEAKTKRKAKLELLSQLGSIPTQS